MYDVSNSAYGFNSRSLYRKANHSYMERQLLIANAEEGIWEECPTLVSAAGVSEHLFKQMIKQYNLEIQHRVDSHTRGRFGGLGICCPRGLAEDFRVKSLVSDRVIEEFANACNDKYYINGLEFKVLPGHGIAIYPIKKETSTGGQGGRNGRDHGSVDRRQSDNRDEDVMEDAFSYNTLLGRLYGDEEDEAIVVQDPDSYNDGGSHRQRGRSAALNLPRNVPGIIKSHSRKSVSPDEETQRKLDAQYRVRKMSYESQSGRSVSGGLDRVQFRTDDEYGSRAGSEAGSVHSAPGGGRKRSTKLTYSSSHQSLSDTEGRSYGRSRGRSAGLSTSSDHRGRGRSSGNSVTSDTRGRGRSAGLSTSSDGRHRGSSARSRSADSRGRGRSTGMSIADVRGRGPSSQAFSPIVEDVERGADHSRHRPVSTGRRAEIPRLSASSRNRAVLIDVGADDYQSDEERDSDRGREDSFPKVDSPREAPVPRRADVEDMVLPSPPSDDAEPHGFDMSDGGALP